MTEKKYSIILKKVGNQPLMTTKILCGALGLGLAAAKAMVDKAPSVLAMGLDSAKAIDLKRKLEEIGNTVSIPGMETRSEAPANTKITSVSKKTTAKKSVPSSFRAIASPNDDFDAIFGDNTAKKVTAEKKTKTAPKQATNKATAAPNDAFDAIFGNSAEKADSKH